MAGTTSNEQAPLRKRRKQLEERRSQLKRDRGRMESRAPGLLIFGIALLAAAPFIAFAFPSVKYLGIYTGLYGVLSIAGSALLHQRVRVLDEEITDINNELDLIDIVNDERERRATKLLQVNQFDLRRYYDQTLRQGNQIFYVGVLCILIGFAVVGAAFWLVQSSQLPNLSDKIVVASLGAISGILANFIAVIYLQMFSRTIASVSKFHERLVTRDRLNFGNILAAKIETPTMRDATLNAMAVRLAAVEPMTEPSRNGDSNGVTNIDGVDTSGRKSKARK